MSCRPRRCWGPRRCGHFPRRPPAHEARADGRLAVRHGARLGRVFYRARYRRGAKPDAGWAHPTADRHLSVGVGVGYRGNADGSDARNGVRHASLVRSPQRMTGRAPAMASVARPLIRPLYLAYLGFILAVLYFPFVVMAILSFQGPRGGHTFPLRGVSTIWYWKLFNPGKLTPYSDVGEFLGDYRS